MGKWRLVRSQTRVSCGFQEWIHLESLPVGALCDPGLVICHYLRPVWLLPSSSSPPINSPSIDRDRVPANPLVYISQVFHIFFAVSWLSREEVHRVNHPSMIFTDLTIFIRIAYFAYAGLIQKCMVAFLSAFLLSVWAIIHIPNSAFSFGVVDSLSTDNC